MTLLVPGWLPAAPLTDLEIQGQAIYRKGISPNGSITAKFGTGRNTLSARLLPCVNCHGLDGAGRPEGTLDPPDITWSELTKPYGHKHSDGRSHGPFNADSLIKAVRTGIDPAGNKLHPAMPRYVMSQTDAEALAAYLKVIHQDTDPGLSDSSIKLGVILPGAMNDNNPLYALLRAYFKELNDNGGIYGRQVDLVFSKSFKDTQSYIEGIQKLVKKDEVFALLGASMAEADKKVFPVLKLGKVPLVTPLILTKWSKVERQALRFRLLPGPVQQARVLMAFAKGRLKPSPKTAIITPPYGEIHGQLWDHFQREAKRYGWPDFQTIDYSGKPEEVPEILDTLIKAETQAVFYFGPPGKLDPLMKEAANRQWTPDLFAPMRVAAREALSLPTIFANRVFLTNPSLPSDYDKKSLIEFQRLIRKYNIPQFYQVQSLYYLAAAKVLVEGLQRAGQKLSRDKLSQALQSLNNFETGLTPKISFGPNRRTGSWGSYILEVDLEKRQFKPGAVWVRLD